MQSVVVRFTIPDTVLDTDGTTPTPFEVLGAGLELLDIPSECELTDITHEHTAGVIALDTLAAIDRAHTGRVWEVDRDCGVSYWYDRQDVEAIRRKYTGRRFRSRTMREADVPTGAVISRLGAPDVRVSRG